MGLMNQTRGIEGKKIGMQGVLVKENDPSPCRNSCTIFGLGFSSGPTEVVKRSKSGVAGFRNHSRYGLKLILNNFPSDPYFEGLELEQPPG